MGELEVRSAAELTDDELASLFTAAYEGYLVPMTITTETYRFLAGAYDLDREAAGVCTSIGLPMVRSEAVNDDPLFIDMMADVVLRTIRRYESGRPLPIMAGTQPTKK